MTKRKLDPRLIPFVNYGLLFFFLATAGFSAVLAITLVYLFQDDANDLTRDHFTFQKRTFWIGIPVLLITVLSFRFGLPYMGYALGAGLFFWSIGRSVVGANHLYRNRPYPTPENYLV